MTNQMLNLLKNDGYREQNFFLKIQSCQLHVAYLNLIFKKRSLRFSIYITQEIYDDSLVHNRV